MARKQDFLYAMKLNALAIKNNEIEKVIGFKNIIGLCTVMRELGIPVTDEEYKKYVTYNLF